MKRKFSFIALFLGILLAFPLIGCGGEEGDEGGSENSGNNNGGNNGDDESAFTADNWQSTLADKYGFTLTVPEGWTFKEGKRQTDISDSVQFTIESDDFSAASTAFIQHIFDLSAAVSGEDGNYETENGVPSVHYEEIPDMMGIMMPVWKFTSGSDIIQIDIGTSASSQMAQIYLVKTGAKTW